MEFKKLLVPLLLGLIGPILIILSEFFPWFSEYNLIELYTIFFTTGDTNSYLFLFPLISGFICLIANILVIVKSKFRIKSVIISFIGLGFQIFFFIHHIAQEIEFLPNANIGLYLGIFGFIFIIINIIYVLSIVER
ncbi:MAG: hypothetical protein ACFFCI_11700 [Promethearchaeota archaeon]